MQNCSFWVNQKKLPSNQKNVFWKFIFFPMKVIHLCNCMINIKSFFIYIEKFKKIIKSLHLIGFCNKQPSHVVNVAWNIPISWGTLKVTWTMNFLTSLISFSLNNIFSGIIIRHSPYSAFCFRCRPLKNILITLRIQPSRVLELVYLVLSSHFYFDIQHSQKN